MDVTLILAALRNGLPLVQSLLQLGAGAVAAVNTPVEQRDELRQAMADMQRATNQAVQQADTALEAAKRRG